MKENIVLLDGRGWDVSLLGQTVSEPGAGRHKDAPVEQQDDHQGHVEGGHRRKDLISNVLAHLKKRKALNFKSCSAGAVIFSKLSKKSFLYDYVKKNAFKD